MAKASTSETGHYKNVANFKKLIDLVSTYTAYRPARQALQLDQLVVQHQAAQIIFEQLKAAEVAETSKKKARSSVFRELPSFGVRLVAELEAVAPESNIIPLAHSMVAKLRGARIGKDPAAAKYTNPQPADTDPATGDPDSGGRKRSVSQRSFDALIDHFDKLIDIIEAEPNYNTNHPELTTAGLHEKLNELVALNQEVVLATIATVNLRQQRQPRVQTSVRYSLPHGGLAVAATNHPTINSNAICNPGRWRCFMPQWQHALPATTAAVTQANAPVTQAAVSATLAAATATPAAVLS